LAASGKPGRLILHVCVEVIVLPLGNWTLMGMVAIVLS
jgi:hypothetical protein